ncbi:MAG: carbon-nitrogen hydrolase family protein [Lentisphaerae bacterium]|jgi:hypothetical protein|nr:carbon-nitrogen hydrolase family protein [Lentisphaerota bacterium]MBT5605735.1 carbon-nitrogen hydrolase family protein [Lentisphaerota bacterium]MBT7061965.1 carbon-nitrogen hydrolase family protein [Lentisphaerota bacterium]MBT7842560.1 carbon-nitrogen hydrolase family protein [Lentisphaerota bacterium]
MARYARLTTCAWGPRKTAGDPVAGNVRQACDMIDRAAQDGGDIICLSELFAHCHLSKEEQLARAEAIPGPITDTIGEKARHHRCYITVGMYERHQDRVYNSVALLDRTGQVAGVYRKVYPTPEALASGTIPGTETPVFETDFGRVGFAICWDLHFLDVLQGLAEKDVQLIVWPSMYQGGFQLRMWAYLAGAYVVSAWPGNICEIIDMNAYPLASTNYGCPIVSADVNFDRQVFLRCTARDKWAAIREAYGKHIDMELMHAQGTFSIASKTDEISADAIGREFDLATRNAYYAACRQQRKDALVDV